MRKRLMVMAVTTAAVMTVSGCTSKSVSSQGENTTTSSSVAQIETTVQQATQTETTTQTQTETTTQAESQTSAVQETTTQAQETTTQAATTQAATQAPTTQAATTQAATQAPTTQAATQAPTTQAATQAPTTQASTSASYNNAAYYVDRFGYGRATLDITDNGNGAYRAVITWSSSAFAYTEWIYDLTYDTKTGKMVCSGGGMKVNFEYKDGNERPIDTVEYSDGTASFELSDGNILWNDNKENAGDGVVFERGQAATETTTQAGTSASHSSASDYAGKYGCGRATLDITDNGDGTYTGVVTWSSSAFAYTEWIYSLTYDANSGKMVCNGGAMKVNFEYTEGSDRAVDTVVYSDGTGSFKLDNGSIFWQDDKENMGADMEFVK